MEFRLWVNEQWYKYVEELESWRQPVPNDMSTPKAYFSRYKWWLKREYQSQVKKGKKD